MAIHPEANHRFIEAFLEIVLAMDNTPFPFLLRSILFTSFYKLCTYHLVR